MKTMPAGKFKAQCLAVIDEVQAKRESVIVTKRGKPVAKMVPLELEGEDPIFGFYRGKIRILGDITAPLYSDEEMDEFDRDSLEQLTPGRDPGELI
jgi:prevent-host-death family protein